MEISLGDDVTTTTTKQVHQQQQKFALTSLTDLSSCCISSTASAPSSSLPAVATFTADDGVTKLRFHQESESNAVVSVDLATAQDMNYIIVKLLLDIRAFNSITSCQKYSKGVTVQFRNEEESKIFHCAFEQWKKGISTQGTYYAAVMENRADFFDRVVVDVGAGSGILSLFAAQAGAKHVYAIEASEMADYARKLIAGNPSLGERITVIKGKVEEVELPEKADILISEPMGTLLVNERMLESYVIARDRFLVPNGRMFPAVGRIHMAPFSDEYLFVEVANKALFWQQQNYFGVDLTPLHGSAFQGYFSQPVVDAFDPRLLVAPAVFHVLDFTKMKEEDLYETDIPLRFISSVGTRVHGLACWFDVLFDGRYVIIDSVMRHLPTSFLTTLGRSLKITYSNAFYSVQVSTWNVLS
ncbi:Probable histone-arginine methyltransferase 1.3 [Linum perenne]